MNRKISLGFALSLMALVAAVTFVFTMSFTMRTFNQKITEVDRLSEKYQRLEALDYTVHESFYREIDEDDMMDMLLKGYVYGLDDPYSQYLTPKERAEQQSRSEGLYTGIGVTVKQTDSHEMGIVEIVSDSPAADAGLQAGDVITAVETISVAADYESASDAMLGEVGSTVSITVRKAKDDSVQTLKLERRILEENTIHAEMLPQRIGYLRIDKFRTVTAEQYQNALQTLVAEGAVGIVFDVRNNGGGGLSELGKMLDPLLPEGDIAFSYDKDGKQTVLLSSDANALSLPFAVLVNGRSASASELFACALRDYADAILVGEKTFGKGILQTTLPLEDGGALIITTATYATGRTPCYHGVGLEPDVLAIPDENETTDTQRDAAVAALLKKINEDAA